MDRKTNGKMDDGQTDRQTDGWQMEGGTDGETDGQIDGRMDRHTDGRTDGRKDEWMNGKKEENPLRSCPLCMVRDVQKRLPSTACRFR